MDAWRSTKTPAIGVASNIVIAEPPAREEDLAVSVEMLCLLHEAVWR